MEQGLWRGGSRHREFPAHAPACWRGRGGGAFSRPRNPSPVSHPPACGGAEPSTAAARLNHGEATPCMVFPWTARQRIEWSMSLGARYPHGRAQAQDLAAFTASGFLVVARRRGERQKVGSSTRTDRTSCAPLVAAVLLAPCRGSFRCRLARSPRDLSSSRTCLIMAIDEDRLFAMPDARLPSQPQLAITKFVLGCFGESAGALF